LDVVKRAEKLAGRVCGQGGMNILFSQGAHIDFEMRDICVVTLLMYPEIISSGQEL
jgi:hypothetical protein